MQIQRKGKRIENNLKKRTIGHWPDNKHLNYEFKQPLKLFMRVVGNNSPLVFFLNLQKSSRTETTSCIHMYCISNTAIEFIVHVLVAGFFKRVRATFPADLGPD